MDVTYLSVPCEVDLQCLSVVLETKRSHGKENILAIDRLALLLLTLLRCCTISYISAVSSTTETDSQIPVRTFRCNEGDEFRNAFLHALLRLLRDLGILGQCCLHNPSDWSKVLYISITLLQLLLRNALRSRSRRRRTPWVLLWRGRRLRGGRGHDDSFALLTRAPRETEAADGLAVKRAL